MKVSQVNWYYIHKKSDSRCFIIFSRCSVCCVPGIISNTSLVITYMKPIANAWPEYLLCVGNAQTVGRVSSAKALGVS